MQFECDKPLNAADSASSKAQRESATTEGETLCTEHKCNR